MAAGGNKGSKKSTGGETGAEHFGGYECSTLSNDSNTKEIAAGGNKSSQKSPSGETGAKYVGGCDCSARSNNLELQYSKKFQVSVNSQHMFRQLFGS